MTETGRVKFKKRIVRINVRPIVCAYYGPKLAFTLTHSHTPRSIKRYSH